MRAAAICSTGTLAAVGRASRGGRVGRANFSVLSYFTRAELLSRRLHATSQRLEEDTIHAPKQSPKKAPAPNLGRVWHLFPAENAGPSRHGSCIAVVAQASTFQGEDQTHTYCLLAATASFPLTQLAQLQNTPLWRSTNTHMLRCRRTQTQTWTGLMLPCRRQGKPRCRLSKVTAPTAAPSPIVATRIPLRTKMGLPRQLLHRGTPLTLVRAATTAPASIACLAIATVFLIKVGLSMRPVGVMAAL